MCHEFSVGCVVFGVLIDQMGEMSRGNCTLESGDNLAKDEHLRVRDMWQP